MRIKTCGKHTYFSVQNKWCFLQKEEDKICSKGKISIFGISCKKSRCMQKLSVAIITFNEEKNIERCIRSVMPIADEIVVVDSFSTDATKSLCEQFNVRFIEHVFEGHIQQKNFAKDMCSHDLVLSLDADEALSEELTKNIALVKKQQLFDGYAFNRLNHFCEIPVKHSGWYPDKSLRLWNRTKGQWGGSNPHDRFILQEQASLGFLSGNLLHYTAQSIEQYSQQMNYFSSISAQSKFEKGIRSNWIQILMYPLWRFIRTYFFQAGFLDGYVGYVVCKSSAHEVFLKYIKLYKLNMDAKQE